MAKVANSGRKKGTPNAIPGQLLEAIVEACAVVGYDRNVYYKDENGNIQIDESKRITGLIFLTSSAQAAQSARYACRAGSG